MYLAENLPEKEISEMKLVHKTRLLSLVQYLPEPCELG
jgi:hypothetical protein